MPRGLFVGWFSQWGEEVRWWEFVWGAPEVSHRLVKAFQGYLSGLQRLFELLGEFFEDGRLGVGLDGEREYGEVS